MLGYTRPTQLAEIQCWFGWTTLFKEDALVRGNECEKKFVHKNTPEWLNETQTDYLDATFMMKPCDCRSLSVQNSLCSDAGNTRVQSRMTKQMRHIDFVVWVVSHVVNSTWSEWWIQCKHLRSGKTIHAVLLWAQFGWPGFQSLL